MNNFAFLSTTCIFFGILGNEGRKIGKFYIKACKIFDPNHLKNNELIDIKNLIAENVDELYDFVMMMGGEYAFIEMDNDYNIKTKEEKLLKFLTWTDNWILIECRTFQDYIKNYGYDSFVTNENEHYNIAVYNSNQIKSIKNKGEWSENSDDIFEDKTLIDEHD